MEKQQDFDAMKKAKEIQAMIRVLPNEAGTICLQDLEEIFSQNG
jgi:hypothetical protein